jgi:hypothetical protein
MNVPQFLTGIVVLILSLFCFLAYRSRKAHAGLLAQARPLDLSKPVAGRAYGKFSGNIIADQPLTAPYSGRQAVTWSAHLERGIEQSDEDGSTTKWDTVWSDSATTPFRVHASGDLWFDARGSLPTLDQPSTFDQYIRDANNPIIAPYAPTRGLFGRFAKPYFHAAEAAFAPGAPAFFIGPVEVVNGFWVARPGQGKEYSVLTWKNEQQVRGRMARAGTLWFALGIIAFAAGVIAILVALS